MKKVLLVLVIIAASLITIYSCDKNTTKATEKRICLKDIAEQRIKESIADTTGFELIEMSYPSTYIEEEKSDKSNRGKQSDFTSFASTSNSSTLFEGLDDDVWERISKDSYKIKEIMDCYPSGDSYALALIKAKNSFGGMSFGYVFLIFDKDFHILTFMDYERNVLKR